MEFPVALPIVKSKPREITHSRALISTFHAQECSLREVYSIERSDLRIKKKEEKIENTALIQIIKRKPFYPAFLFCFQEWVRALKFYLAAVKSLRRPFKTVKNKLEFYIHK